MTVRQTLDAGSPFEIYKSVLTEKYADFTGRARRAEYWWFILVNAGVTTALFVVALIAAVGSDSGAGLGTGLYLIYLLAVFVPSLAVAVRRLHDTNKSGWMLLIGLIPLVGAILLLVFSFTDGDREANQYGPSPKYLPLAPNRLTTGVIDSGDRGWGSLQQPTGTISYGEVDERFGHTFKIDPVGSRAEPGTDGGSPST